MSDTGEPPLAGCKTASMLEDLWMRVGLFLSLGKRPLVSLQSLRLTCSEAALRAQEFGVMPGQFLPGGEAPFTPGGGSVPVARTAHPLRHRRSGARQARYRGVPTISADLSTVHVALQRAEGTEPADGPIKQTDWYD